MCDEQSKSRRQFLAGAAGLGSSAFFLNPVEMLMKQMTTSLIRQAQADAASAGPRNYLNIFMLGAPSRYVFDHWVRANPADALIPNPMVATKYTSSGGQAVGTEYATFNYKGVMVPHLFSTAVASGDGSQRPLTDLLNNMLVIRGYGTGLDGHPFNAQMQQAPVGGISSLTGLAADYSGKYFPAVQWPSRGEFQAYTSMERRALNKLDGVTPLTTLLEGFASATSPQARAVRERNQTAFDKAANVLKSYARSDSFGAKNLHANLDNAFALLKRGIAGIDSYWAPSVARYKNLIDQSMRASGLLGISDLPIISDGSALFSAALTDGTNPKAGPGFDLRAATSTMSASASMAEGFALAEYIMKEGLGTAVEIHSAEIANVSLLKAGMGASSPVNFVHDMHETGAMVSLLVCSAFYRGMGAGILEFSRALGANHWENTLVQLMGDFGRSPRSNGSGSDHGYNQMVTSVYSGCIKDGPFVVGNVKKSGVNVDYSGTQGLGASIDGYNQSGIPTPSMAASTVAALMNVPHNPFENLAAPLVKLENGQIKVLFPARQKEG